MVATDIAVTGTNAPLRSSLAQTYPLATAPSAPPPGAREDLVGRKHSPAPSSPWDPSPNALRRAECFRSLAFILAILPVGSYRVE